MISYSLYETSLGKISIGSTSRGICWMHFGDSEQQLKEFAQKHDLGPVVSSPCSWSAVILNALNNNAFSHVPLDIHGTSFQKQVWQEIIKIDVGDTMTYQQLAACLGDEKSTRAVANACAQNNIALFIPCHRVVGKAGLTGYRWGLNTKEQVLKNEQFV